VVADVRINRRGKVSDNLGTKRSKRFVERFLFSFRRLVARRFRGQYYSKPTESKRGIFEVKKKINSNLDKLSQTHHRK